MASFTPSKSTELPGPTRFWDFSTPLITKKTQIKENFFMGSTVEGENYETYGYQKKILPVNLEYKKTRDPYGPRVFHIRFSATGLRAPVHAELLYLLQSLRELSTYLHSHSHLQRWYFLLQSFLKELHHEHPSPQRCSCQYGPFQY